MGLGGYGVECHFQQYFSYIVAVGFISGGKWNHQAETTAASHWQTLSPNVISSTPHLSWIQTHISGVRQTNLSVSHLISQSFNYRKHKSQQIDPLFLEYWKETVFQF